FWRCGWLGCGVGWGGWSGGGGGGGPPPPPPPPPPGDVLTELNGRTLDAEHLRELQDELRDGQAATLTYRRDGQTHTMTLKRPQ
ncbi:hypothetical protein WA684_19050, partial [Xanthomonas arboricola pv. pruni]